MRTLFGRRRLGELPSTEGMSMWDPVYLGVDEFGSVVRIGLAGRHILLGGETGGGKSNAVNNIAAHGALSLDCDLDCLDGKRVELGMWRQIADGFVFTIADAIALLETRVAEMDRRYELLLDTGRRQIERGDPWRLRLVLVDELAYFTATIGTKVEREKFLVLLRDLVARGRAAGIIVVVATQRPTAEVVSTSLRDLFPYRWALRCTTEVSSDVILGSGWAKEGYSATDIDPMARGVGLLLAEGEKPRRIKAAYLSDPEIHEIAARAAQLRNRRHESGLHIVGDGEEAL